MKTLHLFEITPEELVARVVSELKQTTEELATPQTLFQAEQYLKISEVADLFHVSISTVHNWRKKKILKAHQIGGKVLFKRSEVDNAVTELKS